MKNRFRILLVAVLASFTFQATAQYTQLGPKNEFMLKAEANYFFFMGNTGEPGENGFVLPHYENAVGANIMAGLNISQDWFLGGGVGVNYFHNFVQPLSDPMLGINIFVDFDFRPIWKALMGIDYQPSSINWAPIIGGRAGGNILLADEMSFTPMAEIYGGVNWYYAQQFARGMRNKTRLWHSFYATLGVAYMQQTILLPIRLGWRW